MTCAFRTLSGGRERRFLTRLEKRKRGAAAMPSVSRRGPVRSLRGVAGSVSLQFPLDFHNRISSWGGRHYLSSVLSSNPVDTVQGMDGALGGSAIGCGRGKDLSVRSMDAGVASGQSTSTEGWQKGELKGRDSRSAELVDSELTMEQSFPNCDQLRVFATQDSVL